MAPLEILMAWCWAVFAPAAQDVVIKSSEPAYQLTLPGDFQQTVPGESPPRYVRSCGPEAWAKVSVVLVNGANPLKQNHSGVTCDDVLPFVTLPPDAKRTFYSSPWKGLDIGVVEYRAVVKDLPVIGISAVLPLRGKALTMTVYAPDPLEKELREDFKEILARITKTSTSWHTADEFRKIHAMEAVWKSGGLLVVLYLMVWVASFRGHPMRAHWVRIAWLVTIAVLFFLPISSPGEPSFSNNLAVNIVLPLLFVSLAVRRVKMGIEEG